MKKSLLLVVFAAVAFVMTGCMSTHTNDAAAAAKFKVDTPTFTADVVAGKNTVSGEANVHCILGIITWGVTDFADDAFENFSIASLLPIKIACPNTIVKQGATYNACATAKADAILAAKYKLDIADYFVYKNIKCKVTGYPATIKGIK